MLVYEELSHDPWSILSKNVAKKERVCGVAPTAAFSAWSSFVCKDAFMHYLG